MTRVLIAGCGYVGGQLMGKKITDVSRQQVIRTRLHEVLASPRAAAAE